MDTIHILYLLSISNTVMHDMFKIIHIYVHKINIYTSIVYHNYFNTVQLEDIWLEPTSFINNNDRQPLLNTGVIQSL